MQIHHGGHGELAQMVERALSMGEVEGSMPSFSNYPRTIEYFGSYTQWASDQGAAVASSWHPVLLFQNLLITSLVSIGR